MIRLEVICHRPRTQRLGPDAMPRELDIFPGGLDMSEKKAREIIADVRKAQREMSEAGYPWPGGMAHGFQTQPNDSFYLRVVENNAHPQKGE